MCDVNYVTLFDLDGVIIHNKKIHNKVEERSVEFMIKKLPKKNSKPINKNTAAYINKLSYKNLGHSCLLFGDDSEVIYEYNKFVFDNDMLNFIYSNMTDLDEHIFNNISRGVDKACIDNIGLFTNTPLVYCEAVLYSLNNKTTFSDRLLARAFTSDDGLLKPLEKTYENVEDKLKNYTEIHFLDDSKKNLVPVQDREYWFTQLIDSHCDIMNYLQTEIEYREKVNR